MWKWDGRGPWRRGRVGAEELVAERGAFSSMFQEAAVDVVCATDFDVYYVRILCIFCKDSLTIFRIHSLLILRSGTLAM